jgi:uncharacterized protein
MTFITKHTLVLGASDNPSRYSYLALHQLRANGHPISAIGRKETEVDGIPIHTGKPPLNGVDTVTLYMNALHQKDYYDYLLALKPKRLIFNPGAENDELAALAASHGIEPLEACTLVLLRTGQY